ENAPGEDEVWCRARITNNQTATGLVTITYRHGTAHRVETLPTSCPRMKIGDSSNTSSGLPHFPASTKVHQYSFGMGVQWPVPKCSDCGVVCGNCVALHCICTGEGGASSRKRPGEGLSETPIPLKAMKTEEGGPGESNGGITRHCQCADPTPYPQTAKTRKTVKTPATPSDPAGGPMVPAVASVLSPTSPAPFQNPPPAEVPSVPNVVALAAAAAVAKVAAAQNLSETTSKKAAASSAAPGGNEVAAKSAGARRTTRRSAARPSEAVSGQTESGAVEKEVVEVKQEPMVLTRRRTRSMSKDMEQMKKMTAATSVKDDSSSSASTSSAKQHSSSASATGHKYGDYRTDTSKAFFDSVSLQVLLVIAIAMVEPVVISLISFQNLCCPYTRLLRPQLQSCVGSEQRRAPGGWPVTGGERE
ncbi:hypothetical protein FOZ63_028010, partial [Perkinsus olseni]